MKTKSVVLCSLFVLTLIASMPTIAQRERNYIYLLDCTKSMIGYNGTPNIWEPTKDYLRNELQKHVSGTTLHVVPFQGKTLPVFSFEANELEWEKIEAELEKHVQQVTNTNICDAWDFTDRLIDAHKDNYVILLTDGKDNVKGMNAVSQKLRNWCGKYPHTYAFYVQLTEAAIDKRVVNVINICDNEFIIDGTKGLPVFGSFDNGLVIYSNTLHLEKKHQISFSAAGRYSAKAICSDPYFEVKVVDSKIVDGIVSVKIESKHPIADINSKLPDSVYNFKFEVQSNDVSILNPIIDVQMTNKLERSLGIISEETNLGTATWHDSFLFSGASTPDTLSVDLNAKFNDEAKKDGAVVHFQIKDPEGGKDFQLFYNGKPLEKGKLIINSMDDAPSVLSVVYKPEAREGSRYLTIEVSSWQQLDNINDHPVNLYQLSLRSKYVVNWNPLKMTLMWLGIVFLALLLLWFLVIRRIIFPTFSFDNLQVIYLDGENNKGREDCSLQGARKIVCSASPKSQSGLNKLFCGRIEYLSSSFWATPVVMKPCGSNGITISEAIKAGDAATYRMTAMITPQNGPRRPFVVKRVKTDLVANISIG